MTPFRAFALVLALTPTLLALEASDKVAFVQSREVSDDGKLIKARVKILKAGTYYVAAGHVVDRDARFQFLEGKLSGIKYFETRKIEATKDNLSVDISFPIKAVPPLLKTKLYAAVYLKLADIPVTSP